MHLTCIVVPLLLFLFTFWTTQAQVEWIVENGGVTDYGQNLTLFCKVDNCCIKDSGWVQWNYDSIDFRTLIIDVTGFRNEKFSGKKRQDGFTLVISSLNETDLNRNYSCTYGGKTGAKKLLLKEEAFNRNILSLVVEPDNANVILGNNRTISCTLSGKPSAQDITWYFTPTNESKNEICPRNNSAKYSGGTISDPSLTILNFQTSDSGAYECSATNAAGTGNSNSSVLTCINILSLVVEPDNANVILGNNRTISCTLSGQPSAQDITWYFTPTNESKNEICPRNNAAKYSGGTISDPSLTILNFQTSDSGAYECSATNAAGTGNSNSSVLTCISNYQKLKDSFLSEIAKRLGHDWRQVQINLEITTTELEQIERKYINEPITQTTEALIMWRNRKSSSPEEDNINDLINALEFVQRNDIIDDLKLE
ncbi:neural cell adhesion molecule 1-like isoform X2 [Mytilus edulis]|uniref:neural cell adhesion molecule 1-like isoform X2 n=1 Tax=Mytilus edulis TaxID=6550 RepID=UPI0039EEE489